MRHIDEVLRLAAQGLSQHEISASIGIRHTSVRNYLERARQAGLSWPLPEDLDAAGLEARLFKRSAEAYRPDRPEPDWLEVHREHKRGKDVTLQLLWLEYKQAHPDGWGYTRSSPRAGRLGRVMSHPAMVRAVLLDVGGTLWPDRLTAQVAADPYLERLGRLLPDIDAAHALSVLRGQLQQADGLLVQDTHGELARALRLLGRNPAEVDVLAVRRALCVPAVPGVRLFPGAAELLGGLRRLGLRCVIVSNVQVRGALEYWRDFTDLGVAHLIDAVVTSLEVGFRKPHPAFFEATLREAGCEPAACVMIGNSEANDIQPALALGMRTVRVAIEEPPPTASAAHAVVTSLAAVLGIVSHWIATDPDRRDATG